MIDFTGATNKILDFGYSSSLDDQDPFTVSLWLNPRSANNGTFHRIIGKDNNTTSGTGYWLLFWDSSGNGRIRFNKSYTTQDVIRISNTDAITLDVWQNVIVTYDGTGTATTAIHIYVGGVEVTYSLNQNSVGTKVSDASFDLLVANRATFGSGFDGKIGEVYFWNKVLSTSEIAIVSKSNIRGIGLQVSPTNLKLYAPLDEFGDGVTVSGSNTLLDRSGHSNHGTPSNSPVGLSDSFLSYY